MSASRRQCGLTVDELSGLVAVVLADQPAYVPDNLNSYVPSLVPPCSLPSSSPSTPTRSFLPPIPRSASLFDTLAHLGLKLPSTAQQRASAPTTPVHGHALTRQNTCTTPTRPSGTRTAPCTPGMPSTNDLETPYRVSTLDMGSRSTSGGRKPSALLSKFKKQASALVKTASISNGSPNRASANEHSLMRGMGTVRHTPERTAAQTVSFAPTPVPSVSTPTRTSTSSSYFNRTSTSDVNSSFLECEDRSSFRMSTSKLKNTFFKNRNSHLNASRSQQNLDMNSSQLSVATGATTETATDSAFSTESSDCIPYIPFVLPGQQLRTLPEGPSTAQPRYVSYQTGPPSPTRSDSGSTAESTSTRSSPHSPRTPVFNRNSESQPSVSINSDEQEGEEEDLLSVTSSSVSYTTTETDEFGLTSPNLKSEGSVITLSNGPFGRERTRPTAHPYAGEDDDVFTERKGSAASAEPDGHSVATSESCYSLDTYHDPADEDYRLSRTESQMDYDFDPSNPAQPVPAGRTSTTTAHSDDQIVLDAYTKSRFAAAGASSHKSAPPDIRVESASTISYIPTPTAATYGHISPPGDYDQLHPQSQVSQSAPRYQRIRVPSFGMGRQTVDPRTVEKEAGVGRKGKEQEWTLFLGDKAEEDSFERVRKASQSASLGRKAGKAVAQAAASKKEKGKEREILVEAEKADLSRQRAKSAGPRLLTDPADTLVEMKKRMKEDGETAGATLPPFVSESLVGQPLLRIKSIELEETDESQTEDESVYELGEAPTTQVPSGKERALRRSGSAHPVLDGGKHNSQPAGDHVDWTLMLPLPISKKTRNLQAANSAVTSANSTTKLPGERPKLVKRARSSYDVSSPVLHVRTRKVSSPMAASFGRRDLKRVDKMLAKVSSASVAVQEAERMLEMRHQNRQDSEVSAEFMLAAILDLESAPPETGGRVNKEDHRQKALDMLSGASQVDTHLKPSLGELLELSPAATVSELFSSSEEIAEDNNCRSPSPSADSLQFEEHLARLMDGASEIDTDSDDEDYGEALPSEFRQTSQTYGTEEHLLEEEPKGRSLGNPTVPSPTSATFPYSRPTRTSLISITSITPILGPSPSFAARAPIGVKRDSSQFGLSFSQYGAGSIIPFPGTGSVVTRPASGPLPLAGKRCTSVTVSRHSSAPSRAHTTKSSNPLRPPPITIPMPSTERTILDVDGAFSSRPRLDSEASLSSVCSASSTATVVPSGRSLLLDGMSDSSQPNSAVDTPSLNLPSVEEFDFPLPPASLPLTGVVPNGSEEDSRSSLSNLGFLQRRPSSTDRVLDQRNAILGVDEDTEIPPPSVTASPMTSPRRLSSPMISPRRTSPSPVYHNAERLSPIPVLRSPPTSPEPEFYSHHPFASPSSSVSSCSSQWMDDEEDDGEDEEEEEYFYRYGLPSAPSYCSSASGGSVETEYDDAGSMFAVSDDDYEDAVSMLSGMFYSARTSLDQ